MKKIVIDSNAVAQEKGLETVLCFVENSAQASKYKHFSFWCFYYNCD